MAAYVGKRVKVTTDDGCFEGIIDFIEPDTQKLTLRQVVALENGKELHGTLAFYGEEIKNLAIISVDASDKNIEKQEKKECILKNSNRNGPCSRMKDWNLETDHLPLGNISGNKLSEEQPIRKKMVDSAKGGKPKHLIETIGEEYHEALNDLKKSSPIGLSMEGIKLGRNGKLCLILCSTEKCIYIFDALAMGTTKCFDSGLASIIESPNILKVIHDCRQISDMLYHQYSLRMINIFDTQVADVMIYKAEHGGCLPRYVNSLVACLFEHLQVHPEQVYNPKIRSQFIEEDQAFWSKRPLSEQAFEAAVRNVTYLLELRFVLMRRLLAEFLMGVNIYLETVRDLPNVGKDIPSQIGYELPKEFCQLKSIVKESQENRDVINTANYTLKENSTKILRQINPDLVWSKHIWHSRTTNNHSRSEKNNYGASSRGSRNLAELTSKQSQPKTKFPESQMTSKAHLLRRENADQFKQYLESQQKASAASHSPAIDSAATGSTTTSAVATGSTAIGSTKALGIGSSPPRTQTTDALQKDLDNLSMGDRAEHLGTRKSPSPGVAIGKQDDDELRPGNTKSGSGLDNRPAMQGGSPISANSFPGQVPSLGRGRALILNTYKTTLTRRPLPQEEGTAYSMNQCPFPQEEPKYYTGK